MEDRIWICRYFIESGLCKILAIGCGRQKGAANLHRYDLAKIIVPAAQLIMQRVSILCGLAVTENALGDRRSITGASREGKHHHR